LEGHFNFIESKKVVFEDQYPTIQNPHPFPGCNLLSIQITKDLYEAGT
jgi:hypothetical protein